MVDLWEYVDGAQIKWRKLGLSVVGATLIAYYRGLIRVVLSSADIPLSILSGFASFNAEIVRVITRAPAVMLDRGFMAAAGFVATAGPAGYVVALAITLASAYAFAKVAEYAR